MLCSEGAVPGVGVCWPPKAEDGGPLAASGIPPDVISMGKGPLLGRGRHPIMSRPAARVRMGAFVRVMVAGLEEDLAPSSLREEVATVNPV